MGSIKKNEVISSNTESDNSYTFPLTNTQDTPHEVATEQSQFLSTATLSEQNLENLEKVLTEIIDSELKYTDDMKNTAKVSFHIFKSRFS